MSKSQPEVWMRGPVEGFAPVLQPAVHSLLQVKEELEALVPMVNGDHLWSRPGNAASIGFHVRHIGNALDRLYTYARGESLTPDQLTTLKAESSPTDDELPQLVAAASASIDRALEQLRTTDVATLFEVRKLGRAQLPTTAIGLLFHGAEHSLRHAGQALTTAKVLGASAAVPDL